MRARNNNFRPFAPLSGPSLDKSNKVNPPVHVLQQELHVKGVHVHEVDGLLLALRLGQDGPQQGRGGTQDDGVGLK